MRKILSFLLLVCMIFTLSIALVACGGSDGPDTTVTAEEWAAAFSDDSVKKDGELNVTVTLETSWDGTVVCKFADGKMKRGDEVVDGWDFERFRKSDYSVLDFATAYSYFTYDEEKGVYVFVEDPDESYEISFLDNKLASCKIFLGTGADAEIWTTSYSDVGETVIE